MNLVWLGILSVSAFLLLVILIRGKHPVQWLTYAGLNIAAAGVLLYAANWLGGTYDFHIPINGTTVAAVGTLGLPGLALLAAIKLFVI
jgi:inhibitor of the pro-sigma K processing machinery